MVAVPPPTAPPAPVACAMASGVAHMAAAMHGVGRHTGSSLATTGAMARKVLLAALVAGRSRWAGCGPPLAGHATVAGDDGCG